MTRSAGDSCQVGGVKLIQTVTAQKMRPRKARVRPAGNNDNNNGPAGRQLRATLVHEPKPAEPAGSRVLHGGTLYPEERSGLYAGSRIWRFRVQDPLGSDTAGGALVVWP
jgi:hypothetical protein